MRIWEHQVKEEFDNVIDSIVDFVDKAKGK
jgi:very-short-patch-repair endonuclease